MKQGAWTDIGLPEAVCKALSAAENYKESVGQLAVHPYNRHNPELSTWWQFPRARTPGSIWPAYHLAKFIIDKPADRCAIRVGLHVEKGLGREQGRAYGNGFELKPDWAWHSFVRDVEAGALTAALDDVARRSGLVPEVSVSVGAPLDKPEIIEEYSEYLFAVRHGELELLSTPPRKNKMNGLETVSTLAGMGARLAEATAGMPWSWVNVICGSRIPIGSARDGRGGTPWGGAEFWELALEPFVQWVR